MNFSEIHFSVHESKHVWHVLNDSLRKSIPINQTIPSSQKTTFKLKIIEETQILDISQNHATSKLSQVDVLQRYNIFLILLWIFRESWLFLVHLRWNFWNGLFVFCWVGMEQLHSLVDGKGRGGPSRSFEYADACACLVFQLNITKRNQNATQVLKQKHIQGKPCNTISFFPYYFPSSYLLHFPKKNNKSHIPHIPVKPPTGLSCGSCELKISCPETKKHPVTPKVQVSLAGPQPGELGGKMGKIGGVLVELVVVVVVVVVVVSFK